MELGQAGSLVVVSVAAALLPGLSQRLQIPAPVVEILFGVLLGKSVLHISLGGEWLPFLAQLGFLILMFQAGVEIDFGMLRRQSLSRLVFQLLLFGLTLSLAIFFARMLGRGTFLALVLTTTSLGLVMPTLRQSGLSKTETGQAILLAATLADFLTLLGITFYVLHFRSGFSWQFVSPLALFLGFGVLLWGARMWAWWNPDKAGRLIGRDDAQELGVRFSMALLFLFVALSEVAHLEPVLGAFLGGCVLSFIFREKAHLEDKLSAIGFGFLIPIFFIHVGMQFDLGNLLRPGRLAFTAVLLLMAFAVKMLPALLLTLQRMPLRSAIQAGALLSSRLSLIVAAAAIGLQEGFLTEEMKDSVVLLALLTCLLGPILFRAMASPRRDEKA